MMVDLPANKFVNSRKYPAPQTWKNMVYFSTVIRILLTNNIM